MLNNHPTRLAALLLLFFASGAAAQPIVLRGATMGTTYQIKLVVAEAERVPIERLHEEVEELLAEINRQMSTYRPDSELSRFNRAPAGEWFAISPEVVELVEVAREISAKTRGALDVTVGPLVRLWQFAPADGDRAGRRGFQPPDEAALEEARARIGYQSLQSRGEPPALRKTVDGLEVDLSSIATGRAIDRIATLLEQHGITDYMVEIGGELRAAGRRADGKPWRVAIERPTEAGRELHTTVPLVDAAIATAGDYRKFFEHEGRRYSHLIDPVTGRPVEHELASVTVVADTCLDADAWDTPLVVLGPEEGYACAEEHAVAALFIWNDERGEHVRATSAWTARFPAE